MAEYIEREALLATFALVNYPWMEFEDAWEIVQNAPAADVTPVRREKVEKEWRSHWITMYGKDEKWSKCCNCQNELNDLEDGFFFCPICGAPMTDEGVETMMERLEALKDGKTEI